MRQFRCCRGGRCVALHCLAAGPGGSVPGGHSQGDMASFHGALLELSAPTAPALLAPPQHPPRHCPLLLCLHESGSTCVGAPSPPTWMMKGSENKRISSSFLSAWLYNPLLGTGSGCQIASYICSFPNALLLGANEGLIIGCKCVVT